MSGGSGKQASCSKCSASFAVKSENDKPLCPDCRSDDIDALLEGIHPGIEAGASRADDHPGSLRIDGLDDLHHDSDSWSIRCPICESTLLVTEELIGSKVKCSDCYSKVNVLPRPGGSASGSSRANKKTPASQSPGGDVGADQSAESTSDLFEDLTPASEDFGELTLAPPVELDNELIQAMPLEVTIDDAVEEDDVTQDGNGEVLQLGDPPIEEIEPAVPMPEVPIAAAVMPTVEDPFADDDDDDDEMIELIDMPPEIANADVSAATPVAMPRIPRQKKTPDPVKVEDDAPVRVHAKNKKKPKPEKPNESARNGAKPAKDRLRIGDLGPAGVFDKSLAMLQSIGVYIWAGLAIVLLWVGSAAWHGFGPANPTEGAAMTNRIVDWGVGMAVGRIPCWIGYTLLLFVSGVIFRDAANGKTTVEETRPTDASDFFSTAMLFGFSMFIAALPWLLTGLLSVILPLQLILAVLFLTSAWDNQSPYGIVSATILTSFSECRDAWMVWGKCIALAILGVAIGGGMMDIPLRGVSIFTSLVGAVLVTFATLIYATVTGWLAGEVSDTLSKEVD